MTGARRPEPGGRPLAVPEEVGRKSRPARDPSTDGSAVRKSPPAPLPSSSTGERSVRSRQDRKEGQPAVGRDGAAQAKAFTVGYEGRSLSEVLSLLVRHDIHQVVDVRENAASRKPGFSGDELRATLGTLGMKYVHFPRLGCAASARHAFWEGGGEGEFRTEYRERIARRPEEITELLRAVRSSPSVLLCLEREAPRCHRWLLADRLRENGLEVEDL